MQSTEGCEIDSFGAGSTGDVGVAALLCATIGRATLVGVGFALYDDAGRFALGGIVSSLLWHLVARLPLSVALAFAVSKVADEKVLGALLGALVAAAGASFAHQFKVFSLCAFSVVGGGFGLTMVLHWFACRFWLMLVGVSDASRYDVLFGHWLRLFATYEGTLLEYFFFIVIWGTTAAFGLFLQTYLYQELWTQRVIPELSKTAESHPDPHARWAAVYSSSMSRRTLPASGATDLAADGSPEMP